MEENTVQHDVDPELMVNFLDESEESIATLDNLFVELEQQPCRNQEQIRLCLQNLALPLHLQLPSI